MLTETPVLQKQTFVAVRLSRRARGGNLPKLARYHRVNRRYYPVPMTEGLNPRRQVARTTIVHDTVNPVIKETATMPNAQPESVVE